MMTIIHNQEATLAELSERMKEQFDAAYKVFKKCDCDICIYGYEVISEMSTPKSCNVQN